MVASVMETEVDDWELDVLNSIQEDSWEADVYDIPDEWDEWDEDE
jgi:hypothetical protein